MPRSPMAQITEAGCWPWALAAALGLVLALQIAHRVARPLLLRLAARSALLLWQGLPPERSIGHVGIFRGDAAAIWPRLLATVEAAAPALHGAGWVPAPDPIPELSAPPGRVCPRLNGCSR